MSDHRGVVEVGVEVVVELEGPAAGLEPRALDLPVARFQDLAVQQPVRSAEQRRVASAACSVARSALTASAVSQTGDTHGCT